MKLPRIVFGAGYIKLWQRERQENARLRRELREWQNKTLQVKNVTPLFTPPPKPEPPVESPPVGQIAKNRMLARQREVNHPTAEQVLLERPM